MIKAKALHGAGPEVVRYHVAIFRQPKEDLPSLGSGYLQAEALLVTGAVISQIASLIPPLLPSFTVRERASLAVLEMLNALYTDHLGAKIG